jgi:hypothetical protein
VLRQALGACSYPRRRRPLLLVNDTVLGWHGGEQGVAEEVARLVSTTDVIDDMIGTPASWL